MGGLSGSSVERCFSSSQCFFNPILDMCLHLVQPLESLSVEMWPKMEKNGLCCRLAMFTRSKVDGPELPMAPQADKRLPTQQAT
jgi:hypothetical protein